MILRYVTITSAIIIIFLSGITQNVSAISIVAITDTGSSFPIILEDLASNQLDEYGDYSASSNATSVLNGFGYTALLDIIQNQGIIIWGNDIVGVSSPLVPYIPVDSNSDFVAVVLDTDITNTYSIPEFWAEYIYTGSALTDVTVQLPNVLGYSQSRDVIGSNVVNITDDGIVISGTGSTILKLNDYSDDRIILTGDIPNGGTVKLISPDSVDLINDVYGDNGFIVSYSVPAVVGWSGPL